MTVPEGVTLGAFAAHSAWMQFRERFRGSIVAILLIGLMVVLVQFAQRWISNLTVLTLIGLMQWILSSVTAMGYGVFRGSQWIPVCLQRAQLRVA